MSGQGGVGEYIPTYMCFLFDLVSEKLASLYSLSVNSRIVKDAPMIRVCLCESFPVEYL